MELIEIPMKLHNFRKCANILSDEENEEPAIKIDEPVASTGKDSAKHHRFSKLMKQLHILPSTKATTSTPHVYDV